MKVSSTLSSDETEVQIMGSTPTEIGRKLIELSPNKDGRGLVITLTKSEEMYLADVAQTFYVGYVILSFIMWALEELGKSREGLAYSYEGFIFRT